VVIGTGCIGSYKSNYHTITTTTAPVPLASCTTSQHYSISIHCIKPHSSKVCIYGVTYKKMSIKISSKWHLIGLLKYFQNVFRLYQPFIMDYLTTKYEPMMSDHLQTRGGHIHKRPQMSFTMTYTSIVSASVFYYTISLQSISSLYQTIFQIQGITYKNIN
jgi:hypothetical protein